MNSTSQMLFSLTSDTTRDTLHVDGDLTINGATLQLLFNAPIDLLANPVQILSWTGVNSINFSEIEVSGIHHDVELLFGDNSLSVIPEPSHAVITLLGLGLIGIIIRRKKIKSVV